MLYIKKTKFGRGMFSKEPIKKGQVFDVAPVVVIPAAQQEHIKKTILNNYVYEFGRDIAMALGYGSLYNHSDDPNADYYIKQKEKIIYYIALEDIPANKQIFIDYGYDPTREE